MNSNLSIKKLMHEIKNYKCEIKTLEEVISKFKGGNVKINNSIKCNGNFPCVTCTDIFKNSVFINKHKIFIDELKVERKIYVKEGDLLMATEGYTIKNTHGVCAYLGKEALAGNNTMILKHNHNCRYLINSLLIKASQKQIRMFFKTGGIASIKRIYLADIKKIKIPIPSLELQEKIGDFLFKFAEYEKRLEQELEHRRKQFNYYKELLFKRGLEKLDWEIKELGKIATEIINGNQVTKDQLDTGKFPAIRIKEVYNSKLYINKCINFVNPEIIKRKKYASFGDILVACSSENLKDLGKSCVFLGQEECLIGNDIKILKHKQNPKYLAYALSTHSVLEQLKNTCNPGRIIHIHNHQIQNLKIPLPSLEEQERVVNILDKLYDICEDPDKGIQLLIKNNRKQYEYYRELIFDEIFKSVEKNNQINTNNCQTKNLEFF